MPQKEPARPEKRQSGGSMSEQRTAQQNKSIHLWLSQVADALNDGGFSVMKVMRHDAEIPWTDVNAKALLWHTVQEAMFDKESSKQLTTDEVDKVHQVIAKHLAETTGLIVPEFPCNESLMEEQA